MILTINLPESAGGGTHQVDTSAWSPDIMRALAQHGLQQKAADPAGTAKKAGLSESEIRAKCLGVIETLARGEWSSRAVGPRVADEEGYFRREALRVVQANPATAGFPPDRLLAIANKLLASAHPDHIKLRARWAAAYAAAQAKKSTKSAGLLTDLLD